MTLQSVSTPLYDITSLYIKLLASVKDLNSFMLYRKKGCRNAIQKDQYLGHIGTLSMDAIQHV